MNVLVTLVTYQESRTAYFLKEMLENKNIDCFFNISYHVSGKADQVQVQVKSEDVEKAVHVMMEIRDTYGKNLDTIRPGLNVRRIIVPTDFSIGSENACLYAIHLAQKIKAEVKILHVYEPPVVDDYIKKQMATYEEYFSSILEDTERRSNASMLSFIQKLKEYMEAQKIENVRIHSSIAMGDAIRRIQGISRVYKPDVIVLGTLGFEEDSRSILAGVAGDFIKSLEIPVYAIPGPCSHRDFEKLQILYATDFNENDHTSLNRLLSITESFEKSITCIHIDTAHNPSKKERMDELNQFLEKEYSEHTIRCHLIEDKDVIHGIRDFAEKNRINLLSFTTQKRGIFEKLFRPNLLKKILQDSNLPILIFPS